MLEQMAEAYRKENPSDPDAAPATVGDVKTLLQEIFAPVEFDLSGDGVLDECPDYTCDETVDGRPVYAALKAGRQVVFQWTAPEENIVHHSYVTDWYIEAGHLDDETQPCLCCMAGGESTFIWVGFAWYEDAEEEDESGSWTPVPGVVPVSPAVVKLS